MRLQLGGTVRSADGQTCELADLVLEAAALRVTHVVVQPPEPAPARLVPIDRLSEGGSEPALELTLAELDQLDSVHEFAFLRPGEAPDAGPGSTVGVEDTYANPTADASPLGGSLGDVTDSVGVGYDRIPQGGVELRHASGVFSGDGHHLGRLEGVELDGERRIDRLLLERGHLWWKREIPVPATAVAKIENDVVSLGSPKSEIDRLPSTRL